MLVVGNGQAVVYIGADGRKFERVLVLGDRLLSVARAGVVVGEGGYPEALAGLSSRIAGRKSSGLPSFDMPRYSP